MSWLLYLNGNTGKNLDTYYCNQNINLCKSPNCYRSHESLLSAHSPAVSTMDLGPPNQVSTMQILGYKELMRDFVFK